MRHGMADVESWRARAWHIVEMLWTTDTCIHVGRSGPQILAYTSVADTCIHVGRINMAAVRSFKNAQHTDAMALMCIISVHHAPFIHESWHWRESFFFHLFSHSWVMALISISEWESHSSFMSHGIDTNHLNKSFMSHGTDVNHFSAMTHHSWFMALMWTIFLSHGIDMNHLNESFMSHGTDVNQLNKSFTSHSTGENHFFFHSWVMAPMSII